MPLLEWLAQNYKKKGAILEFVTDRSQEGSQFCKGFGGIGGVLFMMSLKGFYVYGMFLRVRVCVCVCVCVCVHGDFLNVLLLNNSAQLLFFHRAAPL